MSCFAVLQIAQTRLNISALRNSSDFIEESVEGLSISKLYSSWQNSCWRINWLLSTIDMVLVSPNQHWIYYNISLILHLVLLSRIQLIWLYLLPASQIESHLPFETWPILQGTEHTRTKTKFILSLSLIIHYWCFANVRYNPTVTFYMCCVLVMRNQI